MIGPTGVFIVDAKAWSMPPRVEGERLLVGRQDRTSCVQAATRHAFVLKSLLNGVWVESLIVFTKPMPRRRIGNVWIMGIEHVESFIQERGRRLTDEQVNELVARIELQSRNSSTH